MNFTDISLKDCTNRFLKLFEGASQYERFNNIMREIVRSDEHCAKFISLGLNPEHFGTHSIRKGAITHASTGITSSPPIVSICIRANWKMPGVMNRYMRFEYAGDQYVGRSVSGRGRLTKYFAESCPYFDFSHLDDEGKEKHRQIIDNWIKARMPGGGDNNDVFGLFKMCIASFIFHRQWLEEHIHSTNLIRCSPFWNEAIPHADRVVTRFPWDKTTDTPAITGLPPDVLYMAEIEILRHQFAELKDAILLDSNRMIHTIIDGIENSLDRRAVGGDGYGLSREIDRKLDYLIDRVNNPITHNESTTKAGTEEVIEFKTQADEEDDEIIITFDEPMDDFIVDRMRRQKAKEQVKRRKMTVGFHHGVLNPLPSSWSYPKMNMIQLINLYLLGSPAEGVSALRHLNSKHVMHFDKEGMNLSRMKRLMGVVEHYGRARGVWRPANALHYWNGETVTKLWDGVWGDLKVYLSTVTKQMGKPDSFHKTRSGDFAWRTCHDKLQAAGVFKTLKL